MAERYISALTGPEMDAALLDMAQHNSEAWAVGTRNGAAVSSSDDTYNNNSKYYATEAEAAAARAEAAVPAGTEGAVLFSQAQSLTDVQKAQARSNISAGQGGTNPNLIDNAWFLVNQRDQTLYNTSNQYIVDRYYMWGTGSTLGWSADGIIAQGTVANFTQNYPRPRWSSTDQLVASAMLGDGTIYTSKVLANGTYHTIGAGSNLRIKVFATGLKLDFQIQESMPSGTVIRAIKLEKGTESTLANDAPPNYAEELLKCQHYYYASRISANVSSARIMLAFGWVASTDGKTVCLFVPTPVPMRNVPQNGASLASGGFSFLNPLTGAYLTYQTGSITVLGQTQAGVTIQTGANAAITTPFVVAYTSGGGGINLSADL